jgi:uncharacterized protein YegL
MNTEIIVITDRSGSMASIRKDANGGFDNFIREQKEVPGACRVTQIMFDSEVETQYTAKPLTEVPPLDLQPRGQTALLDAIGQAMNVQGARIANEKWADLVVVTIITDGGENASREYKPEQIKTMIEHAEKNGWKFIFLAANQDGFAVGQSYGVGTHSGIVGQTFNANSVGTQAAYAATSSITRTLRSDPHERK